MTTADTPSSEQVLRDLKNMLARSQRALNKHEGDLSGLESVRYYQGRIDAIKEAISVVKKARQ